MENLSLYQITNAFPALMESEEITEENKKQIPNGVVIHTDNTNLRIK